MTTDITEMAQREKFEAWARSQQLSIAYGDCGYVYSSTEMAWRAVKALSAELVEALEKAQATESHCNLGWKEAHEQEARAEAAEKRIAELEHAEQKLCAANVTLDARADRAERQMAELESRTVKLPPTRLWAGITACYEKSDVIAAIHAAGMEVSDD